jgi:purine-binding chemotaxis protein CheW
MAKWNGNRSLEVLTFDLQGDMFAVEAMHVREILDLVTITEVPNSDPFVSGLINVRGKVVPLADLRIKFGMEQRPPTADTRIVVLEIEIEGEPVTAGIRADKVHEVTEAVASALQETPKVGMRWRPEFIRCIGKRGDNFMAVLDIARVFQATTHEDAGSDKPASDQEAA